MTEGEGLCVIGCPTRFQQLVLCVSTTSFQQPVFAELNRRFLLANPAGQEAIALWGCLLGIGLLAMPWGRLELCRITLNSSLGLRGGTERELWWHRDGELERSFCAHCW